MRKIRIFQLILLCWIACTHISLAIAQEKAWKLRARQDGIAVYVRESTNHQINELKIVTVLDSDPETIVQALRDVSAYPQWIYKLSHAKDVKHVSADEHIYYSTIDFPWPAKDRDMVIHSKTTRQKDHSIEIRSKAISGYLKHAPDFVRIEHLHTYWKLTPKGKNQTHLEYIGHTDPGGNIPSSLVNLFLDKGPTATIKDFKQLLRKEQYQHVPVK